MTVVPHWVKFAANLHMRTKPLFLLRCKLCLAAMTMATAGYGGEMSSVESVTISDEIRIFVGSPITAIVEPAGGSFSSKWYRGDIFGSFEDAPIASGLTYTPTADDNEKWLKCEVADSQGTKKSAKVFCSTLPVVYVNTDDGKPIVDKTTDRPGTIFIQGNAEFAKQYNGKMEIHGRGNSSWGFPKQKPYKVKLDKKTDIFGYGKNKHWVLLSNYLDNTCLRNVYGSQLAKALGIVGMDMQHVTLVLNGAYQGVYLFGEHIRIDPNRVDIKDWESASEDAGHTAEDLSWIDSDATQDVTGGYLWELDKRYDGISKFRTAQANVEVEFSRPEYASTSTRMMTWCQNQWNAFEAAYRSVDGYNGSNTIADYADIDAMAKYMLVNVILNNNDAAEYSRYAFLGANAGDKITFGPVWDFDYGGNSLPRPADGTGWVPLSGHPFGDWVTHPDVAERMRSIYWLAARAWLNTKITTGFDADKAELATAAAANDSYRGYAVYSEYGNLRGFDADCTAYKTMLTAKLAWLDAQFASLEVLMRSIRRSNAAHPYAIGTNTTATFNGTAYIRVDEANVEAGDVSVTLITTVANAASMQVYLNGVKFGSQISGKSSTFTIPAASLSTDGRTIMSVVVRNGGGEMVERTFFCLNSEKRDDHEFCGDYPDGLEVKLSGPATYSLKGATFGAPLSFKGDHPVSIELVDGTENAAPQIAADGALCLSGEGKLTLSSSNALLNVAGDIVVSNGTIELNVAAVVEKESAVLMRGNYFQHGGKVSLNMSGGVQSYGFRWKDVKDVVAVIDGGEFVADVSSGAGSAAFKSNKGSNDFTVEGSGVLKATLNAVDARVVDAAGNMKFKKDAVVEVDGSDTATHARVFKSEKKVAVSGSAKVVVEAKGDESEILCSDKVILVEGGILNLTAADDCLSAGTDITVTDGKLQALSLNGDAIDANGSLAISNGYVFATTCSAASEGIAVAGNSFKILGGSVVAAGGAGRMHVLDADSVACYTNSCIESMEKYLVLTSGYSNRFERLSVNLEAGTKRNADGFSLIASVPNQIGGYTESSVKPSKDIPPGVKLDDALDGVFVTRIDVVEVVTNDSMDVKGATWTLQYLDGGLVLPQKEGVNIGKLIVASNTWLKVVYDVEEEGMFFADGNRIYEAAFVANSSTSDAAALIGTQKPTRPGSPRVQLGVVVQRYPWNGVIDVNYRAMYVPVDLYGLKIVISIDGEDPKVFRTERCIRSGIASMACDLGDFAGAKNKKCKSKVTAALEKK